MFISNILIYCFHWKVDLTAYVEKHDFCFDTVLDENVTNDEVFFIIIIFSYWSLKAITLALPPVDVVECLLSCIRLHFLTLYLLFCLTGVPWDCGAYYTNNFPKDKSNMLCIWPDRLYKLNTRSLFSFGVIVTYVLDSTNDYLFYLLGELFGNNLVLAILFTMLQILYCNF